MNAKQSYWSIKKNVLFTFECTARWTFKQKRDSGKRGKDLKPAGKMARAYSSAG